MKNRTFGSTSRKRGRGRLNRSMAPVSESMDPLPLSVGGFLLAEYSYAAQSAFQANEDRARVSSYYLVSAGTAIAAILGVQRIDESMRIGFAAIFMVLFFVGLLTLLQMIRMRQAWFDSAEAMNKIKKFYLERHQQAALLPAFAWTESGLPSRNKFWSVSFLLALTVMIIDACAAGGAIIFYGYAIFGDPTLFQERAFFVTLALVLAQVFLYRRLLRKKTTRSLEIAAAVDAKNA